MRLFYFIILLTVAKVAFGQILNVEKFRMEKDTSDALFGSAGLGFSSKKQSTSITKLKANASLDYLSKKHNYLTLAQAALVIVDDQKIISEGYVHFRMNFWRKRKACFEQFNQAQYDLGRGLQQRWLTGVGARFRIKSSDLYNFSIITGPMLEFEEWIPSEGDNIQNTYWKSSTSFRLKAKLHQNIHIFAIAYYQAKWSNLLQPRITTDASIQFKATKNFGMRLQYVNTADSSPVVSQARYIHNISAEIVYTY